MLVHCSVLWENILSKWRCSFMSTLSRVQASYSCTGDLNYWTWHLKCSSCQNLIIYNRASLHPSRLISKFKSVGPFFKSNCQSFSTLLQNLSQSILITIPNYSIFIYRDNRILVQASQSGVQIIRSKMKKGLTRN